MNAAVLTISDSSFAGTRPDASGPAVCERLQAAGWTTTLHVLPDDAAQISEWLVRLCDSDGFQAIFTTGGTGVAPRDVTPEATRSVIDREIPGIAEWMRISGRQSTKFAILSRGIVGHRGTTLIVNLPGSPKGALQSLDAIMDVVPHVIDLLSGRTEHVQNPKLQSQG